MGSNRRSTLRSRCISEWEEDLWEGQTQKLPSSESTETEILQRCHMGIVEEPRAVPWSKRDFWKGIESARQLCTGLGDGRIISVWEIFSLWSFCARFRDRLWPHNSMDHKPPYLGGPTERPDTIKFQTLEQDSLLQNSRSRFQTPSQESMTSGC